MTVMKKTLLLAVAVAGAFTLATRAQADDALLSPKAKELRDSVRTVSGTTPDLLDRSVRAGSPKAIALAESLRKVPGTTEDKLVRNMGTSLSSVVPGTLRSDSANAMALGEPALTERSSKSGVVPETVLTESRSSFAFGDRSASSACARVARVKAPATATASRRVFFITVMPFFVCCGFLPLLFMSPNTPPQTESLKELLKRWARTASAPHGRREGIREN